MVIGSIATEQVLQAVDMAVGMNANNDLGADVPNYTDDNVSIKVVKIIQSYTGIVNKIGVEKIMNIMVFVCSCIDCWSIINIK